MPLLEKSSHIVTVFFAPLGTLATCYCAYASWVGLHQNAKDASPWAWSTANPHLLIGIFIVSVLCGLGCVAVLAAALVKRLQRDKANLPAAVPAQRPPILEATPKKPALPLTLPELRPRIIAVRYNYLISVKALGLETAHEGEPAYGVTIPDVKLGTSVVTFEGRIPRIESRSTSEWRVIIKHDHGGVSTGNSLGDEMRRQGIGEIAVLIHYEDGMGLRYVSHCRIELDSSVQRSGLAVHTGREELLGKRIEDTPYMPPTAPRPYLEVEDPIDEGFGKTRFNFTNRGGDVAHNVQVQPLSIANTTVVFDPIPIIHVNEVRTTIPNIPGGIGKRHDILTLMEREWDHAFRIGRMTEKQRVEEWETKLTVTYEDFAGKRFEATADLICFPIDRNLRDKNALEQRARQYKTVEVRNIKFRPVQ